MSDTKRALDLHDESTRFELMPYSGPIWTISDGEIGPVVGWRFEVGVESGDEYGDAMPIMARREGASLASDGFQLYPTRVEAEQAWKDEDSPAAWWSLEVPDEVIRLTGPGAQAALNVWRVLAYVNDWEGLTTAQIWQCMSDAPRRISHSDVHRGLALLRQRGIVIPGSSASRFALTGRP